MKPIPICLGPICLGLALLAGAARAQYVPVYSGDGAIRRAEAEAKTSSFVCEKELKAGSKAPPACDRYHTAVLKTMTLEARRQAWCQSQVGGETSLLRVPDSCLGKDQADLRLGAVESLERKASPAAWRKFDQAMGNVR
jgi:hypothetical protein